ncbi:LOW QUALITY PROTEIN: trace amine-associated receptor 8c-like [Parambassis ranga]|uniref:LOW QUALITY PROTEIN: trace amine-associated receptor 8c-like n=1 Tax=Parambassis ranga TaxID=210632 RepID=A0A6P7HIL7_9TELE|nr:LOW QUALITY PROTEIN: trace amine-associated receptor 8c-like [Parambassis ranga]
MLLRKLQTPTNLFLLSLAVTDFLVGLLVMTATIYLRTSCWYFGDIMCSLYGFVHVIILCSSVAIMVLISADRYVAICDPLHYTTRVTERRAKLWVCLCWLCSVLFTTVILKDDLAHPGMFKSCHGQCSTYTNTIEFILRFLTFIVPIIVIVVLYMRVFVVAVSQARAMRSHVTAVSVSVTAKKSELKAARTLGVLVVVFLMCYCPYYLYYLTAFEIKPWIFPLLCYLVYFNSCLNPLIYALFYPWFRKAVKLIVTLQILQPGSCDANIL